MSALFKWLLLASMADPAATLRARLERAAAEHEIAGAALIVMHNDALVFEEAFGFADIENRRPMSLRDDFSLGSAGKPLWATALVMQAADGALTLDAVRQKLSQPGEIDESLLRRRVLDPLGMTLTYLRPPRKPPVYPVVYRRARTGLERSPQQPRAGDGLTSRAADLIPILQLHRRGGRFAGETRLPGNSALEMRRDSRLGWQLEEIPAGGVANVFFQTGELGSVLWCDTRARLDVVFLTHMPLADVQPAWQDILKEIRQAWR